MFLLLFYKPSTRFIQGHALTHLWSLVDAYFRRSAFFVLCLQLRPFSGLLGKAASPPIVTWYVYHGWHLPRSVVVYFYKVYFQHLSLTEKSWGLRSVLRVALWFFNISDIFGGGSKRVWWNFWAHLHATWFWYSVPIFSAVITIVSGFPIVRPLFWHIFLG